MEKVHREACTPPHGGLAHDKRTLIDLRTNVSVRVRVCVVVVVVMGKRAVSESYTF